jgi:DNA-binding response OmpR family regulator
VKILIINNDKTLCNVIIREPANARFEVYYAAEDEVGLGIVQGRQFDLIILN